MSKVLIEEQILYDIGDAIRTRNGLDTTYKPSEMTGAISELPNVYTLDNEGNVVSNGALIPQTARSNEIDVNGTYDTTLNNEIIVNVQTAGGSTPIIQRSTWESLTGDEKRAYGLVIIQDAVSGFERGVLVSGADYVDPPSIVHAESVNASSPVSMSYTFSESGTYQIVAVWVSGETTVKDSLTFTLDGVQVPCSHSYPSDNNGIRLNLFTSDIVINEPDSVLVVNTDTGDSNSGLQLFILQNVTVENISLYGSRYNGQGSFSIDLNTWYLQVAKYGYYSGRNTFEFYEIDNVKKDSTATPGSNANYYYGGTYVLALE